MSDKYWRQPKKAKWAGGPGTAWWYANPTRIEIFLSGINGPIVITRRQLVAYMKRIVP